VVDEVRELKGLECVLEARATLGEGPSWDRESGALIWVDITEGIVHRFDPRTGRDHSVAAGQVVGAAVPRAAGGLVLAVQDGFAFLDGDQFELIAPVEADDPGRRMNDGKCDTAGRFWAGTQSYSLVPHAGSLYRLGLDRSVTRVVPDVTIANGIGWSPDDRLMYYIDTAERRVDVFDYNAVTGAVSERRPLVELPAEIGDGDGMAVDAEGGLWVAMWKGWAVRRYAPDGRLDCILPMPVSHPTSVCFGGETLEELYITSARVNEWGPLPDNQLAQEPLAGAIFRIRPGVRGLQTNGYRG
jgi:sugar lactone lactonase YvrE